MRAYTFSFTFLIVFVFTFARIYYLYTSPFDLFFDEAQYWDWSRILDWGYYSKPPMIAWLIAATTSVCGDTEFCIRLSSPLLHAITSLFIFGLGHTLYNPKAGFWSAITYLTLPAVTLSSTLASTDAALLCFWAASMFFLMKAVRTGDFKWWIATGVTAGLGMLSKYTMILFLPSTLLYLYLSPIDQHYFKSFRLYFSIFLAFLIYLPNLLWNANTGFVSYLHTKDNANLTSDLFNPGEMLEFVSAQFAVFGPILFLILLLLLFRAGRIAEQDAGKFLLSFILPFFLLIVMLSFVSRAHANWSAPIYVPATILVIGALIQSKKLYWGKLSFLLHISIAAIFVNYYTIINYINVPAIKQINPFKRIQGWEALGQEVQALLQQYPNTTLLTDSRKHHAALLYYARPNSNNSVKWHQEGVIKDHYDLTTSLKDKKGQDFILITSSSAPTHITPYFKTSQRIQVIETPLPGNNKRVYYAYFMQGFNGL